jgi:hypothetical protein
METITSTTAVGRYMAYVRDPDTSTYRVLPRPFETVIFQSHEKLDAWQHANTDSLDPDEEVSRMLVV